jgi:predicted CoA-binding protein
MDTLAEQDLTPAQLLTKVRTIAVVGFSANESKPSHHAPMYLVERGWNVIPVNPNESEVAGLKAYASLADVPEPVDLVNVFRPAAQTPDIARQATEIGARAIWLQLGIMSHEARRIAEEAGMAYVEDECAGALARRLDLHPPAV